VKLFIMKGTRVTTMLHETF